MTGGPSQIDTWDPKPDRPQNNRGPFGVIKTKLPDVFICEHLPKQAAMLDRFTIIRSVDAKFSNHEPNMVFQTGNLDAEPRTNREAKHFPAIASIVAKHRNTSQAVMPPYVGFYRSPSHIAFGGYAGQEHDPFQGNMAAKLPVYDLVGNNTGRSTNAQLFQFPKGLDFQRLGDRRALLNDIDRIRRDIDSSGAMAATDVLIIAMGEFGRTPMMGTQDSTDGRDHWPNVMSMAMAGGGLRHGQVIGATEKDGGTIKERAVTPGDFAATLYRYFDVPLTTQYLDHQGRPRNIADQGTPIAELGLL